MRSEVVVTLLTVGVCVSELHELSHVVPLSLHYHWEYSTAPVVDSAYHQTGVMPPKLHWSLGSTYTL